MAPLRTLLGYVRPKPRVLEALDTARFPFNMPVHTVAVCSRVILERDVIDGLRAASRTPKTQVSVQWPAFLIAECLLVNFAGGKSGRWGQGLTAKRMKDCSWLRPRLVGQFEFIE
jgi:hypothetical protein